LDRIETYLDSCFARETPPRVSELARLLGVARERLVETFREHVGMTPIAYLRERQVAAAKQLLRRTAIPITRVGYITGFGTRRTFFRVFSRLASVTPAQFRKRTK
jgi:AraC-like DNA-binding protein